MALHAGQTLAVCMFGASQPFLCSLVSALDPAVFEGRTGAGAAAAAAS